MSSVRETARPANGLSYSFHELGTLSLGEGHETGALVKMKRGGIGGVRGRVVVFALAFATWGGCGWFQTSQLPPPPPVASDIAAGITVTGTPFHRIIVRSSESPDATRLLILYVRLESVTDEVFRIRPTEITLVQPDGTVGVGLDRERAIALLERADISVVYADPAMQDPSGFDRTAEAQQVVRGTIRNELLEESDIQREQAVRGYLVLDARRMRPSLDGSKLNVALTRLTDGAAMRQIYQFEPPPVAAADTPTSTAP